jgi:hypothetical protein
MDNEGFTIVDELECGCIDTCKGHINSEVTPQDDGRLVCCMQCCGYHPLKLSANNEGTTTVEMGIIVCPETGSSAAVVTEGSLKVGAYFIDDENKESIVAFDKRIRELRDDNPDAFDDFCMRIALSATLQILEKSTK